MIFVSSQQSLCDFLLLYIQIHLSKVTRNSVLHFCMSICLLAPIVFVAKEGESEEAHEEELDWLVPVIPIEGAPRDGAAVDADEEPRRKIRQTSSSYSKSDACSSKTDFLELQLDKARSVRLKHRAQKTIAIATVAITLVGKGTCDALLRSGGVGARKELIKKIDKRWSKTVKDNCIRGACISHFFMRSSTYFEMGSNTIADQYSLALMYKCSSRAVHRSRVLVVTV